MAGVLNKAAASPKLERRKVTVRKTQPAPMDDTSRSQEPQDASVTARLARMSVSAPPSSPAQSQAAAGKEEPLRPVEVAAALHRSIEELEFRLRRIHNVHLAQQYTGLFFSESESDEPSSPKPPEPQNEPPPAAKQPQEEAPAHRPGTSDDWDLSSAALLDTMEKREIFFKGIAARSKQIRAGSKEPPVAYVLPPIPLKPGATPAPPPKDRAGQLSLYIAKAHEACFQREKELRKLVDELNKEIDARQAIIDSFHWEPQQTVFSDQEEEDLQKRGLMGGARWEMYQPGDQPMDGDHEDVDMSE